MSSFRCWPVLLLLTLPLLGSPVRAEDDDPLFRDRKLSEWLDLMQNDPVVDRRRAGLLAVELIGPRKSRKVVPALIGALRSNSEDKIRAGAALALGRLSEKARPDDDEIKLDDIRTALTGALRTDKSERVREASANALAQMKEKARGAADVLALALKDPHAGTRTAAANALRALNKDARDAIPELQTALADTKLERLTRIHAANALGRIGAPDALSAVPVLRGVLADAKTDREIRKACAEALGDLGRDASDAVPALADTLTAKETDTGLRRACAAALDQMGAEARPALPALLRTLKDEDRFVRSLSLHAVAQLGPALDADRKAAVLAILVCMDDNVLEVRVAAIEALGTLGSEGLGEQAQAVSERLTEATRDTQKAVSEAAQVALKKLKAMP